MRFHVLGMAHTMTTLAFAHCAYTMKIINFCKMMMKRGHEVYLYAGEHNDAPCTEHIVCITEKERAQACDGHYLNAQHRPDAPHWITFNGRACGALASRAQKGDFLCVIFGMAQKPVADAFPILKPVEYGVGYHYTFAEHRFFESYAWMHMVYAAERKTSDRDGIFFDDVIPGYFDASMFPAPTKQPKDYLLYMGRMIDRKGTVICSEIAKHTGRHLITAGHGDPPFGAEHRGEVGPDKRAELLGQAHAVLAPTIYVEPFGNVVIEAMAMGTPVITTDWGAFTETVQPGVTGFRCRTLQEFVDAVRDVGKLDRAAIREYALRNFSLDPIGDRYERAFYRLKTLWGNGWYELRDEKEKRVSLKRSKKNARVKA
jgi:glycosyltransferase involved in cell wall biosynthesis